MLSKNKLNRVIATILVLGAFTLGSCEKQPGEGGNATITGQVWVRNYNATFTQLLNEYPGMDEDVYIVYGDNIGYDDRTRADYLGNYRFNYLRPGKYTIYVYSKDSTLSSPNGKTVVIKEIEISENAQVYVAPQIIIFN